MNSYLFVLGIAHELCKAELSHILGLTYKSIKMTDIGYPVVRVDTSDQLDIEELNSKLGGTIKIAQVLGEVQNLSAEQLLPLLTPSSEHFIFGFSLYGSPPISLTQLCKEIKDSLTVEGKKCRFVLPHNSQQLSSVVLKKQDVTEYILLFDKLHQVWLVTETLVYQDVDAWARRDTGRPYIDAKSGMLPLKIARIMVNLASSQEKQTLLDPFCGMGSILSEAMFLGWQVIGSDKSPQAVDKTRQNLQWLTKMYRSIKTAKQQLLVSDATHISKVIEPDAVAAIVTEPFLGAPFEMIRGSLLQKGKKVTSDMVKNTIRGLEKLYIGALREWQSILKPGERVVIAVPEIEFFGKTYSVKKPVDTCENLGYTLEQGPYTYSRPQAIVRRKIYVFTKK